MHFKLNSDKLHEQTSKTILQLISQRATRKIQNRRASLNILLEGVQMTRADRRRL